MHVNSLRVGPPQMHPKMGWRVAECLPASVTPVRLRYLAYLSVGWHRGVTFSTHLDIPQLWSTCLCGAVRKRGVKCVQVTLKP